MVTTAITLKRGRQLYTALLLLAVTLAGFLKCEKSMNYLNMKAELVNIFMVILI